MKKLGVSEWKWPRNLLRQSRDRINVKSNFAPTLINILFEPTFYYYIICAPSFWENWLLLSPKWAPFSSFVSYSWLLPPRDVLKIVSFKRQFEFLLNQLWDLWSKARDVLSLMSKFYRKRKLYHCSGNTNKVFQSAFINLFS